MECPVGTPSDAELAEIKVVEENQTELSRL